MSPLASIALLIASTAAVVEGVQKIPSALRSVAERETVHNPKLQMKDAELRRQLNQKLVSLKEKTRSLQQENGYTYQWDASMSQAELGFDITSYSVKYTQCATIQAYSDVLAQDEDSSTVLEAKRFAIFRLCPEDSCSDSSSVGCSSDYGEYMVSMDQFLVSMLEYQQQHVVGYCEYCQECATIEAVKMFYQTVANTKTNALSAAQSNFQTWYNKYGGGGDEKEAQVNYYYYLQNGGNNNYSSNNYANNYANKYYNYNNNNNNGNSNSNGSSGYSANQNSWDNQQMWQFQANGESAWQSMAQYGASGTYFGKKVLNGYFDGNGDFVQQYGYFNSAGEYVSIQNDEEDNKNNEENQEAFVWDEDLFGTMPEEWADYTVDSPSCNYQYAGSCYSQYSACMTILEDEANKNNGYSSVKGGDTLMDYLECTEVSYNSNNGLYEQYSAQQMSSNYGDRNLASQRYFIGPHCGSDSHTINLAVYSDPYCSIINNNVTVAGLLGSDPLSETDLIPSGCLSCSANQYDAWYEGDNVDGIQPFCSMLYQISGKCNANLKAVDYSSYVYNNQQVEGEQQNAEDEDAQDSSSSYNGWKQIYQSPEQQNNEKAVCSFITALTSSTYNENGEVNVASNSPYWNLPAPSQWGSALKVQTDKVSLGMKIGLSIMGLAVVIMAIVVCVLHGQLARKNIPWKPRRYKGEDPTDLARQNSGITMGRSRSGQGTAPLI